MTEAWFESPLRVELTGDQKHGRPIWATLDDLAFHFILDDERRSVHVPAGFLTDFASVPRFFWRFAPPGGLYAAAATVHDWLYVNKAGERFDADRIFLLAMRAAGVPAWRRRLIYRAVRMFGWKWWGS